MKSNDTRILNELRKGNPSAFKKLFDFYYMPLSVYALKYCDSFQLAEDVVQDLFVKLWDEKLYLKFDNVIAPYLFKAVKNNTLQMMKKQAKYKFEEIENQVNTILEDEKLDITEIEEEKKKLLNEVETLPVKMKEIFKAIVLENLKYKEVAEELGVSVNTVKTQYSRALKKLRKSLNVIILILLT